MGTTTEKLAYLQETKNQLVYTLTDKLSGFITFDASKETFRNLCTKYVDAIGITNIGDSVFKGLTALTSVIIPQGITSIGKSAFSGCTGITSIVIPDSVTSIGQTAFWDCESLTSLFIPDSVTNIGAYAFNGCASLESITVAEENSAYHSTDNCLIETVSKKLIAGCNNSIIPNDGSVTDISGYAFYKCSGLKSIVIPDGVGNLATSLFQYCTGLETVTIPATVGLISNKVFVNCSSLRSIIFNDTRAQWRGIIKGFDWYDSTTGHFTIHCTDGDIN